MWNRVMQKRVTLTLSHFAAPATLAVALFSVSVFAADPAAAGQRGFSGSCVGSGASFSCAGSYGDRGGNPHVIDILRAKDESTVMASLEREQRWVSYCSPSIAYDRYGVGRYVYAVRGCEFGRDRD
jgi:hypothetical protein